MEFQNEPVYKIRNRNLQRLPDVQQRTILAIKNWLKGRSWPNDVTIIWDHAQDPEADRAAEEPALYAGQKMRGRGRICRNGAVDALVRDETAMIVPLLVEYVPSLTPKEFWGIAGIAVDSDRHVPSKAYCDDLPTDVRQPSYLLKGTLLVIVTICRSENVERLQARAKRVRDRFRLPTPEIRDVIVCTGITEESALTEFKRIINRGFAADLPPLEREDISQRGK